uniref:PH domain-containing protein n=1 Tax=candidate division CPR3 bacterium TaxID=2268181 RepID=A0A7V3J9S5_UNCC3
MNQIFRFKSFPTPGWVIILLVPLIFIYFGFAPKVFDYFGLDQVDNKVVIGIIFLLPLYALYFLISYPIQAYLKSNSYLEIRDGILNLVMLSKVKWSVPVSSITAMDAEEGQRSVKSDFLRTMIGRGRGAPVIGFSFTSQNQVYEVKPFLQDFIGFKQAITTLNPAIQFDTVTAKSDQDFYNQDLGKTIQEKAHGLPVVTGFGKFVSKLNLVSALIIGLIITFALIIWLAIATS